MLQVRTTGATLKGDRRNGFVAVANLDTGSPKHLISPTLRRKLNAELINDADKLVAANGSALEVEGAAMIRLKWNGKSAEREELIYCLVVKDLPTDLIVSESSNVDLFRDLREAEGPWLNQAGGSVLAIKLDKQTEKEREEADRRRAAVLTQAKANQAKLDKDRAQERNRQAD